MTEFLYFLGRFHVLVLHVPIAVILAAFAVQWLAPLGLFRFSYAIPLRYEKATEFDHGDELEGFQFSIGRAF